MGVDRADYIVYGWKLSFELKDKDGNKIDFYNERYLPYVEGHKGIDFTLVFDGMCGEYCVFGKLIQRASEYEGWQFVNLNLNNLDPDEVKKEYRKVFDIQENELIADPYLFIFSHYS